MNSDLSSIEKILDSKTVVHAYALVKDTEDVPRLLKFKIENEAMDNIRPAAIDGVRQFLSTAEPNDVLFPVEEYEESSRRLYETNTDENSDYCKEQFNFLNNPKEKIAGEYTTIGYFYEINSADATVWSFQYIQNNNIANTKQCCYSGKPLKKINDKIHQLTGMPSFLIFEGNVIFKKINALQEKFKFDIVIKQRAQQSFERLEQAGIVSDISKLRSIYEKEPMRIGKKLMKLLKSDVIKMPPEELKTAVEKSNSYRNIIKYNPDGKIEVKTNKDAMNLLKLLNDQILISEITKNKYETDSKQLLSDDNDEIDY